MKRIRYRLRTLVLASGAAPPIIAALWFAPTYAVVGLVYFAALALLFPIASFLWRNSGSA